MALAAASTAAVRADEPAGFVDGFDALGATEGAWAMTQLQRGELELAADPLDPANRVIAMRAGGKARTVGKAALVHRFVPVGAGRTVVMRGRFFAPEGAALDSVILMDLECASCGLDTNPGVRLYLRDGRLRVDRSKIGHDQAFTPLVADRMARGRWHAIEWRVRLGHGTAGGTTVTLDGATVLDATGDTLLDQAVVRRFADVEVTEAVDRFQVGLTANSNPGPTALLMDDVSFAIE